MDLPLSPVAVMGRAQQPRPAPRLAVGASPHFSPQQLALADTGCQPLCSLVTPVEEVRWCRRPFHKRAPLPFSGKGMSCQWAMAARLNTPRKNGPGNVFWFFTRIGKVSPPHPPADSWKTVERTLEATERLCDDRDSIAHRRREVQDPSPRTRLTTHPQTTDFHQRRHAGADKKRLAPNLPSYPTCQPTQPMALLLVPHKRPTKHSSPRLTHLPRAPLAARTQGDKLLWGTSSSRTA